MQHDWNRMKILSIGNRIRHAINGHAVADWSDPKPELCEAGPIEQETKGHTTSLFGQFGGFGIVLCKIAKIAGLRAGLIELGTQVTPL